MMEARGDPSAFLVPDDLFGARGASRPLRAALRRAVVECGPGLTDLADRRPAAPPKRSGREHLRHGRIASPVVVLWQLLSLDYPCSITATRRDYDSGRKGHSACSMRVLFGCR